MRPRLRLTVVAPVALERQIVAVSNEGLYLLQACTEYIAGCLLADDKDVVILVGLGAQPLLQQRKVFAPRHFIGERRPNTRQRVIHPEFALNVVGSGGRCDLDVNWDLFATVLDREVIPIAGWREFDVESSLDRSDDFVFIDRGVNPPVLELPRELYRVRYQKVLNFY